MWYLKIYSVLHSLKEVKSLPIDYIPNIKNVGIKLKNDDTISILFYDAEILVINVNNFFNEEYTYTSIDIPSRITDKVAHVSIHETDTKNKKDIQIVVSNTSDKCMYPDVYILECLYYFKSCKRSALD